MGWLKFLSPSASSRRQQHQTQQQRQQQQHLSRKAHISKAKVDKLAKKSKAKQNPTQSSNNRKNSSKNNAGPPFVSEAEELHILSPSRTESLSASFESDNSSFEGGLALSSCSESSSSSQERDVGRTKSKTSSPSSSDVVASLFLPPGTTSKKSKLGSINLAKDEDGLPIILPDRDRSSSKSKSKSESRKSKNSSSSSAVKNLLSNVHEEEGDELHHTHIMLNVADGHAHSNSHRSPSKSKSRKNKSKASSELLKLSSEEEMAEDENPAVDDSSPSTASLSSKDSSKDRHSSSSRDGTHGSPADADHELDQLLDSPPPSPPQNASKKTIHMNMIQKEEEKVEKVDKETDKSEPTTKPSKSSSSASSSKKSSRSSRSSKSKASSVMIMITNLPALNEPHTLEDNQSDIATATGSFLGSEFSIDKSIREDTSFYNRDEFSLDPTISREDSGSGTLSSGREGSERSDDLGVPSLDSTDEDTDSEALSFTDSVFAESDGEDNEPPVPVSSKITSPTKKDTSELREEFKTMGRGSTDRSKDALKIVDDKVASPSRGLSENTNSTSKLSYTDSLFDEDDTDLSHGTSFYSTYEHQDQIPAQDKGAISSNSKDAAQERSNSNTAVVDLAQYLEDTTDASSDKKMDDSLLVDESMMVNPTKKSSSSVHSDEMSYSESVFAESEDGTGHVKPSSPQRRSGQAAPSLPQEESKSDELVLNKQQESKNTPSTDFTFDWEAFLENNNDDLRSGKSNLSNIYDMTPIMEDTEGEKKEEEDMVLQRLDELYGDDESSPEDFVNQDILCTKRPGIDHQSSFSTITDSAASFDKNKFISSFVLPKYTAPTGNAPSTPLSPKSGNKKVVIEEEKQAQVVEKSQSSPVYKESDGSVEPLPPMTLPWLTKAFKEAASTATEIKSTTKTMSTKILSPTKVDSTSDDNSWRLAEESVPMISSNRSEHSAPDFVVEASSLPMEQSSTMKVVESTPQNMNDADGADLYSAYYSAYSKVKEGDKPEVRAALENMKPASPSASKRSHHSTSTLTSSVTETSDTVQYMILRLKEEALRRRTRLGRKGDGSSVMSGSSSSGRLGKARISSDIPPFVLQLNDTEPIDRAISQEA